METDSSKPRSRRALLAAAAGAAGVVAASAASAALPLTATAADPNDVVKGADNATTATTSITNTAINGTAFAGRARGTGFSYGTTGNSTTGAGVFGWSVSAPDVSWFKREYTAYTGVFGSAPTNPADGASGVGVWGDSPDIGVAGTGGLGVLGNGFVGVEGDANETTDSIGVWAWTPSTSQIALKVTGRVRLSMSGRLSMATGASSKAVTLAGVTATSKVFAVLATSETGRWVRAVVPAAGKFTVYLNTTLTSSAVVSWFVLD